MSERMPLYEVSVQAGAVFTEDAGWLIPAHYGNALSEYQQACEGAALFDLSHHGKVEVAGNDAGSFLHNLCTNDIQRLAVGTGCEAFLTNAQARVIAHAVIYRLQFDDREVFWLDVAPGMAEKVIQHLDHYLISEQVELADRTRDFALLHLAGPQAKTVLKQAVRSEVPDLAELHHVSRTFGDAAGQLIRHDALALEGYDILCPRNGAETVWHALTAAGARAAGREAYEVLRVEAGTPVYGVDIDETHLAPEVGRTDRAISFTKGCYLGQEPIVRIRDLGHVNRSLLGLKISGNGPVPRGSKLFRGDKEAGHVTSSVVSPRLETVIALAYVRRGSEEPGTTLEVEAEGGRRTAVVASLPFSLK